jgi:hypothetical protein
MSEAHLEQALDSPIMEVYAINNGYLLMVRPRHGGSNFGMISDRTTLTYAKDEVGIAEEIIAAQARHKLDIEPKQGEMFSPEEMDRRKKK